MVERGIRQHQSPSTSHDVANQLGRRVVENHDVHLPSNRSLQATGQTQADLEAIGRPWIDMPIEQYAHVFHLVSEITGRLREDLSSLDAVRSVFPAGTLTGAPKVRAMETIRRFEKTPRGIYGGAFGYIDQSGNLDFAITIRTMLFQGDTVSIRAGAGIVKDSIPEHEDDECMHKARSCLAALRLAELSRTTS